MDNNPSPDNKRRLDDDFGEVPRRNCQGRHGPAARRLQIQQTDQQKGLRYYGQPQA